ncbi:MAG: hypothetical protein Q9205_004149, partial [Flavoplaca limonia]
TLQARSSRTWNERAGNDGTEKVADRTTDLTLPKSGVAHLAMKNAGGITGTDILTKVEDMRARREQPSSSSEQVRITRRARTDADRPRPILRTRHRYGPYDGHYSHEEYREDVEVDDDDDYFQPRGRSRSRIFGRQSHEGSYEDEYVRVSTSTRSRPLSLFDRLTGSRSRSRQSSSYDEERVRISIRSREPSPLHFERHIEEHEERLEELHRLVEEVVSAVLIQSRLREHGYRYIRALTPSPVRYESRRRSITHESLHDDEGFGRLFDRSYLTPPMESRSYTRRRSHSREHSDPYHGGESYESRKRPNRSLDMLFYPSIIVSPTLDPKMAATAGEAATLNLSRNPRTQYNSQDTRYLNTRMAPTQLEPLLKGETGRNTRVLLRLIILCTIAGAAVASRLFSVIRFESIIHEFDPWFNFRATKYLVQHGFYKFWDWFDDRTWHPLGRVTGGTLYPGLMVTSGVIYHLLRLLSMPVDIRNICVLLAPGFSGLTAFASYLITSEMSTSPSAGLLAAAFMGITPGYISRSVAGSYDNEAIAIFLLVFTFFLWIKSIKNGSAMWAALTALFYGYMVSAWGGYVFITNLLPLHAFVLICMGRYSPRLYVSYSTWFALGTLASMQIPFVGFLPVRSSEHMSALGVFGLLQLVAFVEFIRQQVPNRQFQTLLRTLVLLVFVVSVGGLVLLTVSGVIAPWSGRFYSLWDTGYAKIHIPIIASVSEHQPTAWPAFFFDLNLMIWLFPAGVYMCFQHLKDEHVFVVIYAVLASYFAGVMVRLMLTLTPVVCIAAALALSSILDTYLVADKPVEEAQANGHPTGGGSQSALAVVQDSLRSSRAPVKGIYSYVSKVSIVSCTVTYLLLFVLHCTWVTSNAYSSPSVVLASRLPDGSQHIIDDYREAYYWLRQNTPEKAKIMSWWDYGYQIGGMADRPTLVDNNTWNNTHIATVGKAMSSREEVSYPILRQHDVDYVLVVFGGLLGYSGDDINKFLWMVRIAEGIWPDEVKERDFFTARGEYKVDEQATQTMKNSLMYKMSYYNFNALFPAGQAQDRVRGARMPNEGPTLNTLEEAFTSENWIIRIYKVKDLDNVGRDHASAVAFDKGNKKKKTAKRRGPRVLRTE